MTHSEIDSKYFFPIEPIPRLSCQDPLALHLIKSEKPVVLTDANLCPSALKWDLNYLKQHIGDGCHAVFASPNRIFKYHDDTKAKQNTPDFIQPTERLEMTFREFTEKIKNWKPGDKRLYLQQPLNSSVGAVIAADFLCFNWVWLTAQQKVLEWGPLTSNLLLVGMAGNITPVHYDEQQNFFCQLTGEKHCLLFSPDHYDRLYPHPVYHPHDRQSQVDLNNPDFKKFPGLRQLKGHSTVLKPGDTLFIPIYWWHHITSLDTSPYTVSINFWYKGAASDAVVYPLLPRQNVAIMRNIEKMILDALKSPSDINSFFQSMVLGRYTAQDAISLPSDLSDSLSVTRTSFPSPDSNPKEPLPLNQSNQNKPVCCSADKTYARKQKKKTRSSSQLSDSVKNNPVSREGNTS